MALDAWTLGLTPLIDAIRRKPQGRPVKRRPNPMNPLPEFHMKTKLLIIGLLATLLGGCIVVPAHPYAYHPVPRVYVY
jgi:hypothetical protein